VLGGVNCSTGSSFNDGHGHGTHVAGTVAGRDNTFGVVGVAPGAPLYAVRVLDNGGFGTTSTVVCGIDWVTANAASLGIKVANMSLSGAGSDDQNCGLTNGDPMHVAICNSVAAGIVYVVAAGNSAVNYRLSTPAAYTQVLTVTSMSDYDGKRGGLAAPTCSTDQDDTASSFSNYTGGFNSVHTIAGPGRCIYSTWMGGGYATASGTSMATPHVAGTVALCISSGACTGTPSQIMQKIRSDAATLPGTPSTYGFVGDPFRPIGTRYYGYLVFAKRY
jgi:subtilisin family serine protease